MNLLVRWVLIVKLIVSTCVSNKEGTFFTETARSYREQGAGCPYV